MTHELKLVQGSTTIDFSSSNYLVIAYNPVAPEQSSIQESFSISDGGRVSNIRYQNVFETAVIYIKNSLQTRLNQIEEFFDKVKHYTNNRVGDKSYVTFKPSGDSVSYRSEILQGSVSLGENTMAYYANDSAEITISWIRRYYWEGELTAIPLNNPNVGSKTTSPVLVHNDLEGSKYNYVDILGTDVNDGVLPSPLKIETERTDSLSGASTKGFFFANDAFGDPFNYTPMYQGEDASNVSVNNSSFASGGQGGKFDTAVGPANQQAHIWEITKAQAERMKGRPHRVLLSMLLSFNPPRTVQGRIYRPFTVGADSLLGSGAESVRQTGLFDLGNLRFPPTLLGDTQGGFEFQLWIRLLDGQSATSLIVDYAMILPADSFMHIVGSQYDNNDSLVIDGIENEIYMERGADRYNIYRRESEFLHIFPNRDQRIYMLNDHTTTDFINIEHNVRFWYRPRKLTI